MFDADLLSSLLAIGSCKVAVVFLSTEEGALPRLRSRSSLSLCLLVSSFISFRFWKISLKAWFMAFSYWFTPCLLSLDVSPLQLAIASLKVNAKRKNSVEIFFSTFQHDLLWTMNKITVCLLHILIREVCSVTNRIARCRRTQLKTKFLQPTCSGENSMS